MPQPLTATLSRFFSRLFPRSKDIEIRVDSSADANNVYVDVTLQYRGALYRFRDLRDIPSRIHVGDRYFRISQKNRHSLMQLANLDPRFDAGRGFVFPERDVPEILDYLRPKASVEFSPRSQQVRVDDKPLEYEREVSQVNDAVEVDTSLVSTDGTVRITEQQNARFIDDSKYVHAPEGFFKKPVERKLRTIPDGVGKTRLQGDNIPFFLLHDLKRIEAEPRSRVAGSVRSQEVVVRDFEPKVSLEVDGPWIWFDVRYEADRFRVDYREMEQLAPSRHFIKHDDTWIQADKKNARPNRRTNRRNS